MPAPKRLLVLATATTTAASGYVAAADKLGLEIVFGTEEPGAPLELRFDQRDSALRIVQYAMERPLAAIVTVDNSPAAVAGRAASMLGLPYHPPRAGDALCDRQRLELRLAAAGLETTNAFGPAPGEAPSTGGAYAIGGLMTLASLRLLGIFDPAVADLTPLRLEANAQKHVIETLRAMVRAIGLRHGPVYVELVNTAASGAPLAVAEVSAAIPPRYAAALRFRIPLVDDDVSLEELVIRNALGMDISRVYRK